LLDALPWPRLIGLGAWAGSAKPSWNVFRYWTTAPTSASVSEGHGGIEV
jgi:hypothetical protein